MTSLFQHFIQTGLPMGMKPSVLFDPAWYYRQLDGVHDVWSGLRHFVLRGDREVLAPSPLFSGKQYLNATPTWQMPDPGLFHYLTKGHAEGRVTAPEHTPSAAFSLARRGQDATDATIEEAISAGLYRQFKDDLDALRQRQKDAVSVVPRDIIRFDEPLKEIAKLVLPRRKEPRVSILVPVYNELGYTVECIGSIPRSRPKVSYELIVADDASPDPAIARLGTIKNLRYVAQPTNLGFLENCNAAFHACRGEYVLLLNNDAQLLAGAMDAMVATLDADPDLAAVGPKILYPNGRLQEAGCAIDRDGCTTMVGLFADPDKPGFCYDRDVALLLRRGAAGPAQRMSASAVRQDLQPAYCEDADLCLRLHPAAGASATARGRGGASPQRLHQQQSGTQAAATRRPNQQKLLQNLGRSCWRPEQGPGDRLLPAPVPPHARERPLVGPRLHRMDQRRHRHAPLRGPLPAASAGRSRLLRPAPAPDVQPAGGPGAPLRRRRLLRLHYISAARASGRAVRGDAPTPSISPPWCLCWANENWTRHWDGGDTGEIWSSRRYDTDTLLQRHPRRPPHAADPRYIRVDSRPVFLVYRPLLLPDAPPSPPCCRDAFRSAGLRRRTPRRRREHGGRRRQPSRRPISASTPPSSSRPRAATCRRTTGRAHQATDWRHPLRLRSTPCSRSPHTPGCRYKRYPAVFPSWDNTPRQP